jgi:Fe-S-cluster containining protein
MLPKIDVFERIVHTQPAYDALTVLKSGGVFVENELTRKFLRYKLEQAVHDMKETAKHIESELKSLK